MERPPLVRSQFGRQEAQESLSLGRRQMSKGLEEVGHDASGGKVGRAELRGPSRSRRLTRCQGRGMAATPAAWTARMQRRCV
jgi:hypothetical protein